MHRPIVFLRPLGPPTYNSQQEKLSEQKETLESDEEVKRELKEEIIKELKEEFLQKKINPHWKEKRRKRKLMILIVGLIIGFLGGFIMGHDVVIPKNKEFKGIKQGFQHPLIGKNFKMN